MWKTEFVQCNSSNLINSSQIMTFTTTMIMDRDKCVTSARDVVQSTGNVIDLSQGNLVTVPWVQNIQKRSVVVFVEQTIYFPKELTFCNLYLSFYLCLHCICRVVITHHYVYKILGIGSSINPYWCYSITVNHIHSERTNMTTIGN